MFIVRKGEGSLWSRPFKQVLSRLAERYDGTPFEICLWDGKRLRLGAGAPAFRVTFRTRRALCDALLSGSLGLGEAYVRHEVLFDGDLEDVLTSLGALCLRIGERAPRLPLPRAAGLGDALGLGAFFRREEREARSVQRANELGDAFYRHCLDRRLQQSSGYFRAPSDTLDDAQAHKIATVARKLALRRGQRLLDVECGFGHLMFHAAETYGVECLGITRHEAQAIYIREQAAARRLPVEVRVMGYEELDEGVSWDRIVSVGAVCNVGERRIERFCDTMKALLAPSGILLIESATKAEESPRTDAFIRKHVHPSYWLPSLAGMTARAAARGLDVLDAEDMRRHAALTAHHWRRNFLQNKEKIRRMPGVDDAFVKTWDFYLAYVVSAFRTGHLSLVQLVMSNGAQRDYPLVRDWMASAGDATSRERAPALPPPQATYWGVAAPS